jgi:hypothetical protein
MNAPALTVDPHTHTQRMKGYRDKGEIKEINEGKKERTRNRDSCTV